MSKYLEQHRWFTEYGKAYNAKQFMLNLSTTHAEDLCTFASYDAYITGSNKVFYLHEYFKSTVWRDVETTGFATDSTYQIPFRPLSQLKLMHLTQMVNATADQYARYALFDDPEAHPELRPGPLSRTGALQPDNTFAPGTPNAGIDTVWGRDAALLPNNPVLPQFRNCGFKRESIGSGASRVIKLVPVNPQFVRSQVLSREEWQIYHLTVGSFARTYTEQQAVGREELDAGPAIKQIDFALCSNCVWNVLHTVVSLTSEDVKSKIKTLRGQFDVMFNFYSPLQHPAHHFIAGPLALNTKILQYGTAKDQLLSGLLMDRLMTVLGLCFDSLNEGDRSPYNLAWHDFMVDYNSRDDPRVTPKPQHKDAWQSPETLLQFAIDVYGQHKHEGLDHKQHVNFRPAISMSLFLLPFRHIGLRPMALCRRFLIFLHRTSTLICMLLFTVVLLVVVANPNLLGKINSATTVRLRGEEIRLHVKLHPTALLLISAGKSWLMKFSKLALFFLSNEVDLLLINCLVMLLALLCEASRLRRPDKLVLQWLAVRRLHGTILLRPVL